MRGMMMAFVGTMSGCAVVTDLSGLAGDASFDASDAPSETGASDVASDVGDVVVDAQTTPFCAKYADAGPLVYCEDFDAVGVGEAGTFAFLTSGSGSASIDTSDYTSPDASMLTSVVTSDAGTSHAYHNHAMPVAPSQASLSFELKLDAIGTSYVDIIELVLAQTSGTRDLILQIDPTGMTIEEEFPADGGFSTISHPHIAFTWGSAWHHVVLSANLLGTTRTSSLVVDSQTLEANYALYPGWTPALFNVAYGVTFAPAVASPWTMRFDDVLAQLAL